MQIRFITSVFGDRHVNMLIPLLHSIKQSNPLADVSVYWEDIEEKTQILITKAFPQVEFIKTNFNFSKDITKRISSKTLVWEFAAHDKKNESGWLLFIDADMLVTQDIHPLFETLNTDIIFTYREGQFWINSGTLACRNCPEIANFFTLWRKETQKILNDPILFSQANNKTLHYGGADQMSFQKILDYSFGKANYTIQINNTPLHFFGIHCKFLNETYSVPITQETRIIHYKGGWRDILFFGGNFTSNRPKKESWEMYIFYLKTFQEAVNTINTNLHTKYTCKNFGLVIPWYLDNNTLQEKKARYPLYVIIKNIQTFFPRLKKFLSERGYWSSSV